ncbi:DUF1573 domain-containing protein [Bacteroides sp.]|uniref:DUF1573 domain-containing protein n=1 Tax=Bacteroides sp. TaxID=29523 RepID=UPI002636906D|nr:DUF1573 domain-containing protein [Bacteroides sp.]MDD3037191.1 DUF1573 domain-containing protein [Bacteroides sp.]
MKFSKDRRQIILTEITLDKSFISFGDFAWEQEQKVEFVLTNIGVNLLVIDNINTSCGCITVDYIREPVRPGYTLLLNVTYKAEYAEHFDKTITIYCNVKDSPFQLKVTGNAK